MERAVAISAPASMPAGSNFMAGVNFAQVTGLNAFQLQLKFNPNIIQVAGVCR